MNFKKKIIPIRINILSKLNNSSTCEFNLKFSKYSKLLLSLKFIMLAYNIGSDARLKNSKTEINNEQKIIPKKLCFKL